MTTRSGVDRVSTAEEARLQKRIDVRLAEIRLQLEKCRRSHGTMCTRQGMTGSQGSDIVLIDVEAMRLVRTTTQVRYLALSYVWGGVQQFYATKANISELMENGALQGYLDKIPTTIRHSMKLACGLKIQFLWVDALCIIQDDLSHKNGQIAQMAAIYSQSYLTIVAAEATDATSHLSILKSYPRTPSRSQYLGARSRCEQLVSRLLNSTYGSRGWTFQERVLSPRILYDFADHALLLCPSGLWLMDSVSRWQKVQGYSKSFRQLSPLAGSVNFLGSAPESQSFKLDLATLDTYALIATEYTTKQLTYESDIQLAFCGIAERLSRCHQPPLSFLYGLPERYLDSVLLWHPATLAKRRKIGGLPSWSWMAWIGPIGFSYHMYNTSSWTVLGPCPCPCIGPIEIWSQSEKRLMQRESWGTINPILEPCKSAEWSSADLTWPQEGAGQVLRFRAWCMPFKETFTYKDAMIEAPETLRRLRKKRLCPGLKLWSGKNHCVGWVMGISSQMLNQYEVGIWRLEVVLVSQCDPLCMFSERIAAGQMMYEACWNPGRCQDIARPRAISDQEQEFETADLPQTFRDAIKLARDPKINVL
ncbi:het-domain protein [Fusarium subglutinans]|uniref:Het-domain protein n=1 Tax=Gibberella subglutinans TaxID=42677 RepID=A0A8H5V0R1_GIBSU|nr:het-domain protein [Fusarium subglutinans]KAF5606286.1 het-domain protein [Fusarium subglutinans]